MERSTRSVEYPIFESMTVTIFDRHLEWLNRRFRQTGITRSAQVREALELLMDKLEKEFVDQVTLDGGGGAE